MTPQERQRRYAIQLDLFSDPATSSAEEGETFKLIRPHKWAHGTAGGTMGELPLTSIEVVPFESRWMWATCLDSRNGSGQGCKALPKWGRFAPSKREAVERAADEVRAFMHRATADEQARIGKWLGEVLAAV
jgi:hypothetical protein